MQYALLIYLDPAGEPELTDAEQRALTAEYFAIRDEPGCVGGGHLQPADTATTVRVQDGSVLTTDGPFAETKEVFAGYFIFDVADLDAALQIAARVPAARMGGSVEVRPLAEVTAAAQG